MSELESFPGICSGFACRARHSSCASSSSFRCLAASFWTNPNDLGFIRSSLNQTSLMVKGGDCLHCLSRFGAGLEKLSGH